VGVELGLGVGGNHLRDVPFSSWEVGKAVVGTNVGVETGCLVGWRVGCLEGWPVGRLLGCLDG